MIISGRINNVAFSVLRSAPAFDETFTVVEADLIESFVSALAIWSI